MFTPSPISKPVIPTAAIPYDPKVGPVIRPEHWTDEMLAEPLTQALLANQTDPAGFLNARRARCNRPTEAVVVTEFDGTVHSVAPFYIPSTLCSGEDATRMLSYLMGLGMDPMIPLIESVLGGGGQRYDWRGETRRSWMIGSLNVGGLILRYAVTLAFIADEMTKSELKAAGMLR